MIILFAGIAILAFGTIAMMSKQTVPDANETPELYQEYQDQQAISKPFLTGFQVLMIFILLAIVGIGVVMFLKAVKGGL
jgi:NADH:ubiquinone oxidoreductase subunit 6 (subunit J)